jgi:hypothetical protein
MTMHGLKEEPPEAHTRLKGLQQTLTAIFHTSIPTVKAMSVKQSNWGMAT